MKFIADLHIHSKYSRATAKNLDLEHLYTAAQVKGISLVGTGDFTHPAWVEELETKLVPAGNGLFALREDIAREMDREVPKSCRREVRFILQCEISNIYKKDDRVRKNHNLIYFPDMASVKQFNARLDAIGNIHSDGRPILGLDAEKLLEIMLETNEDGIFVPAHIWTPWFSMFGSKSGFDSMSACFGSLTPHIFAVETGLSSDPPMNWRVKDLDHVRLLSNSDAHSPGYLGRNASVFDTELDYFSLRQSLETANSPQFLGTLDMYPEEGKYHFDGHRKCGVCLNPDETARLENKCPECGRGMTLGVLHRVRELADRPEGYLPQGRQGYTSIIPLADILSEIFQVGPKTKKVNTHYQKAVENLGPELHILTEATLDEIHRAHVPLLAEAIEKMRSGDVNIHPGYDGEFGKVALFSDAQRESLFGLGGDLFGHVPLKRKSRKQEAVPASVAPAPVEDLFVPPAVENPTASRAVAESPTTYDVAPKEIHGGSSTPDSCESGITAGAVAPSGDEQIKDSGAGDAGLIEGLNPEQRAAVDSGTRAVLIQAGPGTGKTRTLTAKIAHLVSNQGVDPGRILALTFTNKAARELDQRIQTFLPRGGAVLSATFHGFCLQMLKEYTAFSKGLVEDDLRLVLLGRALDEVAATMDGVATGKRAVRDMDMMISRCKQQLQGPDGALGDDAVDPAVFAAVYRKYDTLLVHQGLVDFEDLIFGFHTCLARDTDLLARVQDRFQHLFIDEYQDLNHGQYELVRLLAGQGHITAIGDPDQSIYGFRGSDNRYFKQFDQDYPGCCHIRLNRNYRSTQTILDASFQMISKAEEAGDSTQIFSHVATAQKILIKKTQTETAEAVAVGKMIASLMGGLSFFAMDVNSGAADLDREYSFGDFAVLYRTRAQAQAFIQVFQKEGIPFQTADRTDISRMAGIGQTLALFRLTLGRHTPRDMDWVGEEMGMTADALDGWIQGVLKPELESGDSRAWLDAAMDHLGVTDLISRSAQGAKALADLQALARAWTQPADFMDALALNRDPDQLMPGVEKVNLMTLHAAKGLEFPVVFVAGCEEGLMPHARDGKNCDDLDEERRLFYVAMTRAMDILCLTYAAKRRIYGTSKSRTRSRFIDDIERQLALFEQERLKGAKRPKQTQMELF